MRSSSSSCGRSAAQPGVHVVLVSGRPHDVLERYFSDPARLARRRARGMVPRGGRVAAHHRSGSEARPRARRSPRRRSRKRHHGARVERKTWSCALHYRQMPQPLARRALGVEVTVADRRLPRRPSDASSASTATRSSRSAPRPRASRSPCPGRSGRSAAMRASSPSATTSPTSISSPRSTRSTSPCSCAAASRAAATRDGRSTASTRRGSSSRSCATRGAARGRARFPSAVARRRRCSTCARRSRCSSSPIASPTSLGGADGSRCGATTSAASCRRSSRILAARHGCGSAGAAASFRTPTNRRHGVDAHDLRALAWFDYKQSW